jgi:hypothetical protein
VWDLETIKAMNQKASFEAKRLRKRPLLVEEATLMKNIPHLGTLCSGVNKKHKRIATLFIDLSGFGSPGEGAMTQDQFVGKIGQLIKEHGPVLIGLEEVGQFQGYVAVWIK